MYPIIYPNNQATTVVAKHTNEEAIQIVRTSGDTFGLKLVADYDLIKSGKAHWRDLTPKQWAWIHYIAQATITSRNLVEAIGDEIQLEAIVKMLAGAKDSKLKFPKIELRDANGKRYKLDLFRDSNRFAGSVRIYAVGGYYLGRIASDGLFFPESAAARFPGLVDILAKFAADPASVVREYGKVTGRCCFCRLKLTDENSVQRGYGPICKKTYHMP